jgi:hypothetical protein
LAKEGLVSFYDPATPVPEAMRQTMASFLVNEGLAFSDVLSVETIEEACREAEIETPQPASNALVDADDRIYTLPVTLWAFLSQMVYGD